MKGREQLFKYVRKEFVRKIFLIVDNGLSMDGIVALFEAYQFCVNVIIHNYD